jgi:hypothetical protein
VHAGTTGGGNYGGGMTGGGAFFATHLCAGEATESSQKRNDTKNRFFLVFLVTFLDSGFKLVILCM